jgi:hypothetical protein
VTCCPIAALFTVSVCAAGAVQRFLVFILTNHISKPRKIIILVVSFGGCGDSIGFFIFLLVIPHLLKILFEGLTFGKMIPTPFTINSGE